MWLVLNFVIGSVFGSFFMLVGERMPLKRSIIFPPSHCSSCHSFLMSRDMIPIVSYLLLKGKCRFCHVKLPHLSLFVEFLCGCLCVVVTIFVHPSTVHLSLYLLITMSILLSITDLLYYRVEPLILFPFTIVIILVKLFIFSAPLYFLESVTLYLFLSLLNRLLHQSLGKGDIKLLASWTLFIGLYSVVLVLFISSLTALLYFFISIFEKHLAK